MKKFTIDRIEGSKVVLECENGDFNVLDRASLPKNIKEGDILRFDEGSYFLSAHETAERKKKMKALLESLLEEE